MTWERARKPEQKQERRAAILASAKTLVVQGGLESASLSAIARGAELSKANLYRYFESREAILLDLMLGEQRSWYDELVTGLHELAGRGDIEATAGLFARAHASRPLLGRLMANLGTVLEHNVALETVADFKRRFSSDILALLEPLGRALPQISEQGLLEFLWFHFMVSVGAWPHAHPSPVVEQVLARDEMAHLRVDLESLLCRHASTALRGLAITHPADAGGVSS